MNITVPTGARPCARVLVLNESDQILLLEGTDSEGHRTWEGRVHDQYERFFVARATEGPIAPCEPDSDIISHRWWNLFDIVPAQQEFARRLLTKVNISALTLAAEARYVMPLDNHHR